MAMQERLPPSGRDFDVYQLIMVERRSTREVAAEVKLSQTRVCQIVQRVGEFLVEVMPPGTEGDKERQIRVGEQIAAERVQHLYGLAVRSFERSQGEQRTQRQVAGFNDAIVTVRTSYGEPRYLATAGRLALLATKLPPPNLRALLRDYEDEEASEDPLAQRPQEGDCSQLAGEPRYATETLPRNECATSSAAIACDTNLGEAWANLRTAPPTVQLPVKRSESEQSQTQEGQPLNRHDRRARQKLLEQKLKRARKAG